jgi:hypothetical protein
MIRAVSGLETASGRLRRVTVGPILGGPRS